MISREFALAIALLRVRESGTELTDAYVLAECEAAKVDPSPVMLLVQRKAQAAWPMIYERENGSRLWIGARLSGVWFDVTTHFHVAIDTPEVKEALAMLMELEGVAEPRTYANLEIPITIHPREIKGG